MKLQRARLELGLGRIRAAKLCGMDYSYLYKIESGKLVPGLKVAMRISRALGLDPRTIEELAPAVEKTEAFGITIDLPEAESHPEPALLTEPMKAKMEAVRRRLLAEEKKTER